MQVTVSAGAAAVVLGVVSLIANAPRPEQLNSLSAPAVHSRSENGQPIQHPSETEQRQADDGHLPIDRVISLRAAEITEAEKELVRLDAQVDSLKTQFSTAGANKRDLPGTIQRLNDAQRLLDDVIPQSRKSLADAQKELAAFQSTAPVELSREHQRSDATRQAELASKLDQLEVERKEREARRARLGAQTSPQDEALHARQQKRLAQQRTNEKHVNNLMQRNDRAAEIAATLARKVAAAQATLAQQLDDRRTNEKAIEVATGTLSDSESALQRLPAEIASLDVQRTLLRQRRSALEESCQIAMKEQQRLKAELVRAESVASHEREKAPTREAGQHVAQVNRHSTTQPISYAAGYSPILPYSSMALTIQAPFYAPPYSSRLNEYESPVDFDDYSVGSQSRTAHWTPKVGVTVPVEGSNLSVGLMSDGGYGIAQQRGDGGSLHFNRQGFSGFSVSNGSSGNAVHFDVFGNLRGASQATPYGINYIER